MIHIFLFNLLLALTQDAVWCCCRPQHSFILSIYIALLKKPAQKRSLPRLEWKSWMTYNNQLIRSDECNSRRRLFQMEDLQDYNWECLALPNSLVHPQSHRWFFGCLCLLISLLSVCFAWCSWLMYGMLPATEDFILYYIYWTHVLLNTCELVIFF